MHSKDILEIYNVSKTYSGVTALTDISFNVKKGSVHALCGENGAGKSTLMKILSGEIRKDNGQILLNGKVINWKSPIEALNGGIVIIPQELHPFLDLSITENLFLGREISHFGIINKKKMDEIAKESLKKFGLEFDVKQKMNKLSIAQMQLVEIVKALSYNSKIIIMDEPTSALGEMETIKLFEIIKQLKNENKTIFYISHRLKEIYKVADDVTVLRDGKHIITTNLSNISMDDLISTMIGKKISSSYFITPKPLENKNVVFSVKNLSYKNKLKNISFSLYEKEILGIFGLMGSGRSSLIRALFGLLKLEDGMISSYSGNIHNYMPANAISSGLAYVTEDRQGTGLIIDHTVKDNLALPSLSSTLTNFFGILLKKKEKEYTSQIINEFSIKTAHSKQLVKNLSGGNQQKVVLGKWAMTNPRVLFLDEPTRGVDVGAKQEIYQFMNNFLMENKGIIIISSELPEILSMSHRVLIFKKGEIVAERNRSQYDQEEFMRLVS